MAGNGSPYWGTNARNGLGWLDAPAEYNNTDQYNNTANTTILINTIIQPKQQNETGNNNNTGPYRQTIYCNTYDSYELYCNCMWLYVI